MELGHQVKHRKSLPSTETTIDSAFFDLKFKINGKIFKIAVDHLLRFEEEDPESWSDAAIDKALNDCSYYRFTFIAASEELAQKRSKLERDFETWLTEKAIEARQGIIEERLIIKEEKNVPNSWFGSITKEEISRHIIKSYHDIYYEKQDLINEIKKNETLLKKLHDIMHDRGGYIQSIGKRRLELKKINFKVYGESLL